MNLPPYSQFPALQSETILLREVRKDDYDALFPISYYDGQAATDKEAVVKIMEKIDQDYRNGATVNWVITERSSGRVMGTLGFYRGFANDTGELGCILLPEFRGKGIMNTAIKLVIAFGLEQIALRKIVAMTRPTNTHAIKLLERLDFDRQEEMEGEYLVFVQSLPQ